MRRYTTLIKYDEIKSEGMEIELNANANKTCINIVTNTLLYILVVHILAELASYLEDF